MQFARLRLTGFKSFCDTTELVLEPGLTGVVGPNGCGKSNLVEALRWAMGESSYKAMRAGGMDDVIFSGSARRPGRNSAEVALVLDNTDRSAPAHLGAGDVVEVTRRIEREAGSVYRINGKEVRARDVQLLFADASTGAHSPALVRQGQIGELIAAKPVQRRALLEEAAGISGLNSRRQEAETRLRAAEQNLERVEDIVAQFEVQLETLKRQARLAIRYRGLSGDVRKTEAALFHVRWVAARVAENEEQAEQGKRTIRLGDAMSAERAAVAALETAEAALPPLREAAAVASARVQRLRLAAEQLDNEEKRAAAQRADLTGRQQQLVADKTREEALRKDSGEALERLTAEAAALRAEATRGAERIGLLKQGADASQAEVAAAETELNAARTELASLSARRQETERQVAEAANRLARIGRQLDEARATLARLVETAAADDTAALQAQVETARDAAKQAEQAAIAAEEAVRQAQAAVDAARPALADALAALNQQQAEVRMLERILAAGGSGDFAPIVDGLKVAPGFEAALDAALGEDLQAPGDARAAVHWAGSAPTDTDPVLPPGAVALSERVSGDDRLMRRLRQVGVVARADGARLAALLQPGQRLVSREGDLWRWDGLVARADATSAAAERMAQRNRLAELLAGAPDLETGKALAEARVAEAGAVLEAVRGTERSTRDGWRTAQREIETAQRALDQALRAASESGARRAAAGEAVSRLEAELADAQAGAERARSGLADTARETELAGLIETGQRALGSARAAHEESRRNLQAAETEARVKATRHSQIESESVGWTRRREAADAQIATLAERAAAVAEQLAALAGTESTDFTAQREALLEQVANAETEARREGDRLAAAEAQRREADKAVRLAVEALSAAREALARTEERIKGILAQRQQIEQQVVEALGIAASRTAEAAGIRPEQALPEEAPLAQRLERLKAERERLGGVNLSAEEEAQEVEQKLATLVKDRDDVIDAIAKLRSGIQSLNREGRQRLSEAFEKVNGYFQEIFTTLFGGGEASLSFIESEDPLEAGLEITARPPGKKPATMTLLSGGEQALTALSLIFAVFLTNPAPICVLDEVDAPLDDANVERFCTLLDMMCQRTRTRFLAITHNPITMARMDRLYGVTMAERGVSQLVSVDLNKAQAVYAAE